MFSTTMYFWPLLFLSIVVASLHHRFDLCIDYFVNRNIKLICVLDCELGGNGITSFTKEANSHHMLVSVVDINKHSSGRVERCLQYKQFSVGVVLSAGCRRAEQTLLLASEKMMITDKHMWLIIEDSNDTYEHEVSQTNITLRSKVPYVDNLNISVDADIVVASKNGSSEYSLHEIYNFGKIQGGELVVNLVGSWDSKNGVNVDLNGYKYYRRWNFQQWQMRMIYAMSPVPKKIDPRVLTDRKRTPGLIAVTKTSAMVLHVIAEMHNFGFKYTVVDRWIGTFEPNSTRVVANSLYFREQDITPILRFQKHLTYKLHIVYIPVTSLETRYYYRIPTNGPGKFENQFLRPLSTGSWLCLLAVAALCVILLRLSALFERRTSSGQYAVFSVVATICQQCDVFEDVDDACSPRPSAARKLVILVTGLSCVLVYNYYTSSVVSWLLNGPPPSITSLRELLESPLELIFEDVGYTRSWLQTPNYYYNRRNAKIEDELRAKVYKKGPTSTSLVPLEKGINLVKAGGYAYHTETDRANDIISRTFTQLELCELGSLQSMEKTRLHPSLQYRSPYKEFFVWSLQRLTERGVVSCVQRRTRAAAARCAGSSPRALALGGAAPAFVLLAAGAALAAAAVLLERYIYTRTNRFEIEIGRFGMTK